MLKVAKVFRTVNTPAESCGITKLGGKPFRVSDLETVTAIGGKIVGCTKLERTDSTTHDRVSAGDKMYIVYTEVSVPDNTKYCICVNDSVSINEWIAVIPRHVEFADMHESDRERHSADEPGVHVSGRMTATKVFKIVAAVSACVVAVCVAKILIPNKTDTIQNSTQLQETKTVTVGGGERTYTYGAQIADSGTAEDEFENNATMNTEESGEDIGADKILPDADNANEGITDSTESMDDTPHIPDDDKIDLVTPNDIPEQLSTVDSADYLVESDFPGFTSITLSDTNKSYTFVNDTGWKMKVSLKRGKKKLASYSVGRNSKLTQDISSLFNETCEVRICYTFLNDKDDVVEEYSSRIMVYVI